MNWKPITWATLTEKNVVLNPSDSRDRQRDLILHRNEAHLERVFQMLRRLSMKTKSHIRGEIGSDPEDPNIHSHVIISTLEADVQRFQHRQSRFEPRFEWEVLCLVCSPDLRVQGKAHRRLISNRFEWEPWKPGFRTYDYTLEKHQNQGAFIFCPSTSRCRSRCIHGIVNPSTTGPSQNLT